MQANAIPGQGGLAADRRTLPIPLAAAERERIARDAEAVAISSALRSRDALDDLSLSLRPEHFGDDSHRRIWRSVLHLHAAGKPVGLVSVAEELIRRNELPDVGGPAYLAEIYEAAPAPANADYYAGLVRDQSLLRGLYAVGQRIVSLAAAPHGVAADMLAEAERDLFRLAESGCDASIHSIGDVVDTLLTEMRRRMTDERGPRPTGLLTGLADLDGYTAGFHPGQLIVVAARPSIGKTAAALALVRSAIAAGNPVLFSSIEQSAGELATRLLCAGSGVEANRIRHGTLTDGELVRLEEAGSALLHLPLSIDDHGEQGLLRIAAQSRRLKRRKGLAMIVVDYLQLVAPDDRRVPRHEQVATISRRLKQLARELQIPVLALAQLNREVEHRSGGEPKLSDLKDSGGIEQDADLVILLHRPPETPSLLRFIIAKQRNGPTGACDVAFDRATMRFGDAPPAYGGGPTPFE